VRAFWDRPEWLYPAVVITIEAFVGNVAIHALRRAGAATAVAVTVLAFRFVLVSTFSLSQSPIEMPFVSQVLILPAALALDTWYAARLKQAETNITLIGGSLALAAAFLAVSLPLLPLFLSYPRVIAETIPAMIVMGAILGLWSGWLGARAGGLLGNLGLPAEAGAAVSRRVVWIGAGALGALAAFAAFFILTATPPVS
jgi:hypothetical protein